MTNHAPFRYRVGGWVGPASEHQGTSRETSRVNKPWGTKPATKKTYRGQGSEREGTMAQRESGGTLSWDGTKYFSSVLGGENFAIKPNCSIRSRMSSLTKSFRRNLENTCSTSSMLRTPLSLSFSQCLETFGSWEIINWGVITECLNENPGKPRANCGRPEEAPVLISTCYYVCAARAQSAFVRTSSKNEWNA